MRIIDLTLTWFRVSFRSKSSGSLCTANRPNHAEEYMIQKGVKIALAGLVFFAVSGLSAQSYLGTWTTISDKDGKPKSKVLIFKCGKNICGKITKLLAPEVPNPKCDKCPGNWKGKPIQGLVFMYGLKPTGPNAAEGGKILDPTSGSVYSCNIKVVGDKLNVRGYLGISLAGRTQTWVR